MGDSGHDDTIASGGPSGATQRPAAADDTLVATPSPEVSAARIRPSRPSLGPSAPDYPELGVVDPTHYVIGRELARGGMGRIQVARDRRLGREVAVKEVLTSSGTVARRFEREARITARLQHPNIISVHEAGKWPSGEPFYTMRLVTGRSLDEAIAAAKTFAGRLALLPNVLAIADAMAYAHGHQVIHRDLKPRNVIVGEFGETVVIDWGLAKELSAGGGGDEPMSLSGHAATSLRGFDSSPGETTDGEVLGTPAYMPIEQAEGRSLDERADVYAIGSILYHVLAGAPPYVADSNAALIAALVQGPPAPLGEQVPTELRAIVDRAMARDRDKRYPTALALAEDLRRYQTGQLVGAHRYSLRQLLRRWMRRHRTALVALGAALLATIGIGIFAVHRIVGAEAVAQEERGQAIANRAEAEELLGFLLGDLRKRLREVGKLDLLETVANRAIAYFDAHAATSDDDVFFAAIARNALAEVFIQRGDLGKATTLVDPAHAQLAALADRRPDNEKYRAREIAAAITMADLRIQVGKRPDGIAIVREVAPRAETHLAKHPDDGEALHLVYTVHARLVDDAEQRGEPAAALLEARAVIAIAERAAKVDPTPRNEKDLLNAHAKLGRLLWRANHDKAGALAEYRLGLAIGAARLALDPRDPHRLEDVAISHEEIGKLLADTKDFAGAVAEYRAADDAIHRALAVDPTSAEMGSSQATIAEKIGMALLEEKDYAGALAQFQASDATWLALMKRDPQNNEWIHGHSLLANKLGDVQLAMKDPRAAIASYRVALAIREKLVASDPANASWRRDLFYSHYKLVGGARAANDKAQIIAELRAALQVADGTLAAHPDNEQYANDASEVHHELGAELAGAEARAEFTTALAIAKRMAARAGADPDWAKLVTKYEASAKK